jgi:hypothetical protein
MKQNTIRLRAGAIAATAAVTFLAGGLLTSMEAKADSKSLHEFHAAGSLVRTVRRETWQFRDVNEAAAQGYAEFLGCVSSPHEGAMGVHFVNGGLVGDGALEEGRPEALIYEPRHGRLKLVAVEYVVLAEPWHAANEQPPVLDGQVFNYVGSPNRYGLPAFYELHVWAFKKNPHGTFADHNPRVSCEQYSSDL